MSKRKTDCVENPEPFNIEDGRPVSYGRRSDDIDTFVVPAEVAVIGKGAFF